MKKNKPYLILIVISLLGLFASSTLFGKSNPAKTKESRSQSIDFEGDLIEGVNKRPLDSLNQISEANRRRNRPHLYHKRTDFHPENLQKLRELRYVQ